MCGVRSFGRSLKTRHADTSLRKFCGNCGGHLFSYHPRLKVCLGGGNGRLFCLTRFLQMVDVLPIIVPKLQFVPAVHLNYQKCIVPINDSVPKRGAYGEDVAGPGM